MTKVDPIEELEDTIDEIFRVPGVSSHTTVSSCSPSRPESEYFEELAELVHEALLPSLQGADKKQLREMLKQLKEKKSGAVQEEDVSSSGPAVLASHIGPMVLEALNGFLFVLNVDGMVEYASENVTKYLSFSQGEMMNRPIYNFVMPGDHEYFSQLLPDCVGWMLQFPGTKERRSQSFSCRFVTKPGLSNAKKDGAEQGRGGAGGRGEQGSGFVSLYVSAISLPYPTESHREDDDLFNTLNPPHEAGACLVCVARKLPGDMKVPSSSGKGSVSRQFVLCCSSSGLIKNVEHRDFTVEPLFPKSLTGQHIQSLCPESELGVLRTLLDHNATEYSSLLRFLIRGDSTNTVLTVQARSKQVRPPNTENDSQIECTVTRVDSSPTPSFLQCESNPCLSTNQSVSVSGSSYTAAAQPDSYQQSSAKGQTTKDNQLSPTIFYPSNLASPTTQQRHQQIIIQQQQLVNDQQHFQDAKSPVNQMPKYTGPMLQSPGGWNHPSNVPLMHPSQQQLIAKNQTPKQILPQSKVAHVAVAGQPQQFENLSPLPVEMGPGSESSDHGTVGQPDTLQQLCSSIFDDAPPPSTASAPPTSLMSPSPMDPGLVSPYGRAQSAIPDTFQMEAMTHQQSHFANSPGFFQHGGGVFPQQAYPGAPNSQNHYYHLYHPNSYPGERGGTQAVSYDPQAPPSGPPPKGKGKKQKSKAAGGNGGTPKPRAPKGTGAGRKKKAPASSSSKSPSAVTVTVAKAPVMQNTTMVATDHGLVPCSLNSATVSSMMDPQSLGGSGLFSQGRDEHNTILKSLLHQPEQLASCGMSPGAGSGLLHQLLNEDERSPPLVSSSTSCQIASNEVSSSAYHPYPQGSNPTTPSPGSSGAGGTPGSGGNKRRPSVSCEVGPIPNKQQTSPSNVVGSTTPSSVLVQLLQKDSSHTPTLPTSIATSPLDKLAKENKEKQLDTGHRISTTVAEQLNRSRNGVGTKGQAQQNSGSAANSSASVPSTPTDPIVQGFPQVGEQYAPSPGHPCQPMEPAHYGQAPYPGYYEGVPPGYVLPHGHPGMAVRGAPFMPPRRLPHPGLTMQHSSEQPFPYSPKGPLPGMYGIVQGMRQPMSAPPFMQSQHSFPGAIPASASMIPPGTPYGPRGAATSPVFSFDEVNFGARMGCAQTTPRPMLASDIIRREAMTAGRQGSILERQMSYELAQSRSNQVIDPNMVKPPAYPGVTSGGVTQTLGNQLPQELVEAGNESASNANATQQNTATMEPSFFDGLGGGFDLDDESTRNIVFQYLQ